MNKKTKIGKISLIAISLILITCIGITMRVFADAINGDNNNCRVYEYNAHNSDGWSLGYSLSNGNKVYLGNARRNTNANGYSAAAESMVLSQPNIMCVQRNNPVHNGKAYTVEGPYQATDPVIEYLLANSVTWKSNTNNIALGDTSGDYQKNPYQIALWNYLSDISRGIKVRTEDARIMLNDNSFSRTTENFEEIYGGKIALNDALNYASSKTTYTNPVLNLNKGNDNKVTISLNTPHDNTTLTIKEGNTVKSTNEYNTGSHTITYIPQNSSGEVTVIASYTYNTYKANYYILNGNYANQRLIAVYNTVNSQNKEVKTTDTIQYTNPISLQKFILQKNGNLNNIAAGTSVEDNININLKSTDIKYNYNLPENATETSSGDMTGRWSKIANYRSTGKSAFQLAIGPMSTTSTADEWNGKNNKLYNPVIIQTGDTVTYQIILNNVKGAAQTDKLDITDYLQNAAGQRLTIGNIDSPEADANIVDLRGYYTNREDRSFGDVVKRADGTYTNVLTYEHEINSDGSLSIHDVGFGSGGKAIKILITLRFNTTYSDGVIGNYAKLSKSYSDTYNGTTGYYRYIDADFVIIQNPDLSLQKYISKVTDINGEEEIVYDKNAIDNKDIREDRNASNSSKPHISGNIWAPITDADENNNVGPYGPFKSENPVSIEAGDIVTYTIKVYNNTSVDAKDVKINDTLMYYSKEGKYNSECNGNGDGATTNHNLVPLNNGDITIIDLKNNGTNDNSVNLKVEIPNQEDQYPEFDQETGELKSFDLPANSTATITMQVKFNNFIGTEIIANYAKLCNYQSKTCRTMDADYINMKHYAVSLEKYIVEVSNSSRQEKTEVNGRDGKAEYLTLENDQYVDKTANDSQWTQHNQYKFNNLQTIEIGDTVKYNIVVKNDGETDVYISEILDYLNNNSENAITLTNLKNTKILPGETGVITYSLQITQDNVLNNITKNTAEISVMKNRNEIEVPDTTPNNNKDSDYIKLKQYKVSLEKYVSAVSSTGKTGDALITDTNSMLYNCNTSPRNGHAIYNEETSVKENDKVKVETGDSVTYTIVLTNTGENDIDFGNIGELYISDACPNGLRFSNISALTIGDNATYNTGTGTITYTGILEPKNSKAFEITYEVIANSGDIENTATVSTNLKNRNKFDVTDSDGEWNNTDKDWLRLKKYAVSLEKYISKVNNTEITGRSGKAEYLTLENSQYVDKTVNDSTWTQHNQYKCDNVVTVSNGDKVTYTIKVNNDSKETGVYIQDITDYLPDGVKYNSKTYSGTEYNKTTDNKESFSNLNGTWLIPGQSAQFTVEVEITEPNISLNVLKNTAEIKDNKIKNRNNKEITDTTPNNNKDSDYIQLKDITISGMVWNDKALNKDNSKYNGYYDDEESKLSGINVYLYRNNGESNTLVASKATNENGAYSFSSSDLNDVSNNEKYIKASRKSNTNNKWDEQYFSYYIVFEYNGIEYTSTFNEQNRIWDISENTKNSNASEDNSNGITGLESRISFNSKFNTINNSFKNDKFDLTYKTKNEEGFIPQSNYYYDSSKAGMKSSTNIINIGSLNEAKLNNINLGLRGRDVFDLELYSDVEKVKVTVNGQSGVYKYNNGVQLRSSDINQTQYIGEKSQAIRRSDVKNDAYTTTGLGIEVTYKITVKNTSQTDGTATKVINYYDSKYDFVKAFDSNGKTLTSSNGTENSDIYKSIIVTTPGTDLTQSSTMDIYLVYTLNNAETILSALVDNNIDSLATYNMAEISEYTTKCADGQTEYTRGLIDKDSAPGSANIEQVRTIDTEGKATATTGGNPTTVNYYFAKTNLNVLKYEDDTYATPTLYFVIRDNNRNIQGIVFRDNTATDSTTHIKTGDGQFDIEKEVGVYGATVELVENGVTRYTTTTEADGTFTISGFLPGNYKLKYSYGDTINTVLWNQAKDNEGNSLERNQYSFNGEDYQATNNIAFRNSIADNYWYLTSGNVSIANDDTDRRTTVTTNVMRYSEEDFNKLNAIRKGAQDADFANKLKDDTSMFATSPDMTLGLEYGSRMDSDAIFGNYEVNNMNFGIAEVPVIRVKLLKNIQKFTITDSTGQNILAGLDIATGTILGDTLHGDSGYNVQIEDEKLQGARLQITYAIKPEIEYELNYDGTKIDTIADLITVKELKDYISNNLSYNPNLDGNGTSWEVEENSENSEYSVIVKVKNNALNSSEGWLITLERVLSAPNSTLEQIITSTVETFVYSNRAEITSFDLKNVDHPDRVRTEDNITVTPNTPIVAYAPELSITPPTGTLQLDTIYLIAILAGIIVLAAGAFGIKKFVIDKKK